MRQLTSALLDAREGTGEVRAILLRAAFRPRLPGALAGSGCGGPLRRHKSCQAMGCACCNLVAAPAAVGAVAGRHDGAVPPPATWRQRTGMPACPAGLTKMVSKLSKEGAWRKALEVFEAVEEMG